jgi:hypothetical protein
VAKAIIWVTLKNVDARAGGIRVRPYGPSLAHKIRHRTL